MIGSKLVMSLRDHLVVGMDKKPPLFDCPRFIQHDLTSPFPPEFTAKFDLIIHLAANARVHDLVLNPELSLDNIKMTFNVLEYARKSGCKKVIFASSREIYGNGNAMPVSENIGSQRTSESPYASSKLAGESYCHSYAKCYGIDIKIVRFSNVYGKYDFSNRFIPKTIRNIKAKKPIEIWGKDKILDFTHLHDAVGGLVHLIEKWPEEKEFNIAYGKGETLVDVTEKLKKLLKSKVPIVFSDSKVGEVAEYTADISKMKAIGWKPRINIDEGLKMAVEYYATH